jgi:hypothetical protein
MTSLTKQAEPAMTCPACGAALPWTATEAFPAVASYGWTDEGDCEHCCAEIQFFFDAKGAAALRCIGFSK